MLLGLLTMGTIFVKIKVSKLKMEAKKIGVFWWMIPMSSIIHLYPHKNKVLQFPKKYLKIQWILSNQHVLLIGSIRNSKWKRHNQRIVISRSASYRKLALKRMFPSCFFEKRFIFFFRENSRILTYFELLPLPQRPLRIWLHEVNFCLNRKTAWVRVLVLILYWLCQHQVRSHYNPRADQTSLRYLRDPQFLLKKRQNKWNDVQWKQDWKNIWRIDHEIFYTIFKRSFLYMVQNWKTFNSPNNFTRLMLVISWF